jgi:hypothetical protein
MVGTCPACAELAEGSGAERWQFAVYGEEYSMEGKKTFVGQDGLETYQNTIMIYQ